MLDLKQIRMVLLLAALGTQQNQMVLKQTHSGTEQNHSGTEQNQSGMKQTHLDLLRTEHSLD